MEGFQVGAVVAGVVTEALDFDEVYETRNEYG